MHVEGVRWILLQPTVVIFAGCFVFASPVWPHGGGLDSFGCHNDRKHGGYHCHQGPLAGQGFNSKSEMMDQLKESTGQKKSLPKRKELIPPSSSHGGIETCIREKITQKIVCGDTLER